MGSPLVRVLQLAVTVGCFVLLWHLADGAAAMRLLADAHPAWIGVALLMLTLQTVLSALRWRLTASRLGIALSRGTAVREYYLAQIVNQLLPGGILGDAGRAIRARNEAGLLASGQAVLFERLAGQIALFALFAAGVVGTRLLPGEFTAPVWLLPLTLLLAPGGYILLRTDGIGGDGEGPERRLLLKKIRGLRAAFYNAVAAPEVRTQQLAMSLGTASCNVAAFACCAAATNVPLTPATTMVLIPLILFSMLIPLSVSGWGLREGAAAALLPLAGATSTGGLAASVAFGLTLLLAASPGLIALVYAATPAARSAQLRP